MQLDPRVRRASPVIGGVLLFVALLLLRLQLAAELEMTMADALEAGMAVGWLYDLGVLSLFAAASAAVVALFPVSHLWLWIPSQFVIWLAALANVLHFRFFQLRLDWWVVRLHWRDMFAVGDSAGDLGMTWQIGLSCAFALGALALAWWGARGRSSVPENIGWRLRGRRFARTVVPLIVLGVVSIRLPHWIGNKRHTGMVLSDQILRVWYYEMTSRSKLPGMAARWIGGLPADGSGLLENPSAVLAQFRDWQEPVSLSEPAAPEGDGGAASEDDDPPNGADGEPNLLEIVEGGDIVYADDAWPLAGELRPDAETTRALRERLGLPTSGPINVVVLFVESLRAFELLHPEIGPQIFAGLWKLLREHGVLFSQAYSSSLSAGQTVRGEFSTSCGMLPNTLGAATFIAHTTTRVHCLASMLGGVGYTTLWMNAYKASFHSKRPFEMLHGTQAFYEGADFEKRGITQRIGGWGLADEPVLRESVRIMEQTQEPFYVNLSTVSTHHPHSFIDEGPVPEELLALTRDNLNYQKYLSQLKYADRSIGAFFDTLFASPLADRTLVVMLGDHSITTNPHEKLSHERTIEMRFRIPIAVITRNMPTPVVIDRVVHQSDVAPTVARIVGESVPVSWISRGLFAPTSTPWVYLRRGPLHYRTPSRACYTQRDGERHCYSTAGIDPLFAEELTEIPEVPEQSAFFALVAQANLQAISLNRILPP